MCWQAARELEAECVRALWQLFVPGRLRANWCKQRSRGLLHESTRSRGVGFLPETLLGLHSSVFHVGEADLCAGSELAKGCAWLLEPNSRSPSFIALCEVLRVFSWLLANARLLTQLSNFHFCVASKWLPTRRCCSGLITVTSLLFTPTGTQASPV